MKKGFIIFAMMLLIVAAKAQKKPAHINQFADLTTTVGQSQGSVAAAYVRNWKFGKHKRLEAGLGLRWTSYFGVRNEFITAPAKQARTNTTPFLIFFAGQRTDFHDTLTVQRPLTHSLNISINLGYNFNRRWNAGFNIDLIGFTIGRKSSAILQSYGVTKTEPAAKPAAFNLLLTGDHDLGSLNSEFFLKYKFNSRWGIKAVYQFLFIEYKTEQVKQIAPDGVVIDRFRNKSNNVGLGVSYNF